jgi:hypothetical protein
MARAPPPLLALKKQVNGGSIMIQDELRALYDQMSDEEKNENSVLKGLLHQVHYAAAGVARNSLCCP